MKKNVSFFVVEHLRDYGVKYAFGVIGSAMCRIFQALGETEGIDYVCTLHEQGASMGADGYARSADTLGVCIATCGPGTTNVMTGCAGSYTDSIPVLYLVGYPNLNGTRKDMKIRHLAYQEFDIVSMFKPITKYVKLVERPEEIRYELEKAISIAMSGRKGPTMLVLPENVMFSDVEVDILKSYKGNALAPIAFDKVRDASTYCLDLLKTAKKPVVIYGGGVRGSGAVEEARELAEMLNLPIAPTYPMRDLLGFDDPKNTGSVGIFGTRAGNFAVMSSDLIIAIGTRLEGYFTGKTALFAPKAKIVAIDIDRGELDKLSRIGIKTDRVFCLDAKQFIKGMIELCKERKKLIPSFASWVDKLNEWKKRYPIVEASYFKEEKTNPYAFLKELSNQSGKTDRIVIGSGMACAWVGQAFDFKKEQRWIMQYSIGAMGYGLPAAIGASFATKDRIIMVTGDGSIQMSINELATVQYINRDIKIFVVCNEAYGLIQKTQDDWNCGHYATDREHHVALPDSLVVARAYGLPTYEICKNEDSKIVIKEMFSFKGPAFCAVHIPIENKIPVRAKGGRLDNLFPFLPEEEVRREMEVEL